MIERLRSSHWLTLFRLLILLLLSLLVMSCTKSRFKPTYPVKGRVLVNGEPAQGVTVRFFPLDEPDDELVRPTATTDANGWFIADTYKQEDGMPAGSYAVTIVWLPPGFMGRAETANKLPAKYSDAETSGIKVQIVARQNMLQPFELEKK